MFNNYKYYINKEKGIVVALSTYAGKNVRGIAKCDPRDEFDEEIGMKIAASRCATRVAKRRVDRAVDEYLKAIENFTKAQHRLNKMRNYLKDSTDRYTIELKNLNDISATYSDVQA